MQRGPPNSPAAVFIFKDDGRAQAPWDDAGRIPHVRIELHTRRAAFLEALSAWHSQFAAATENTHLIIYSHAFALGISPCSNGTSYISWAELRAALQQKVAVLWLLGCKSEYALRAWARPTDSPATKSLLVTTSALDWHELLPFFQKEIDSDDFAFFDEMASLLRKKHGRLGGEVMYLNATGDEWSVFPEREYVDPSSLPPPTKDELKALSDSWADMPYIENGKNVGNGNGSGPMRRMRVVRDPDTQK